MNQKATWRRFVSTRGAELRDEFPGATSTHRRICPVHGIPIPQTTRVSVGFVQRADGSWRRVKSQRLRLSGLCKPCVDGLYRQLAREYTAAQLRHEQEEAA
jgi:hypothetical protein